MSLVFLAGLAAAAFVESIFLGTLLLYLTSIAWKVPEMTLKRSVRLCAALFATSTVAGVLGLLLTETAPATEARTIFALLIMVGGAFLQWQWTKGILQIGGGRAAAVWLSAWVPLTLVNAVLGFGTKKVFAEAFTAPTGGMATTILGAHGDRVCENCGCEFPVSLVDWQPRDHTWNFERSSLTTACPNCREHHVIDTSTAILRGDRFLLDKTARGGRWSVVAFRNPQNRRETYLSRLVGLPGEAIEVIGGEIFINGKISRKKPETAFDLWSRLHDTASRPNVVGDDTPQWQPREGDSEWRDANGQWVVNAGKESRCVLDFSGRITNFTAYNVRRSDHDHPEDDLPVRDVMATCEISNIKGDGCLTFEWECAGSRVDAIVGHDGTVRIDARTDASPSDGGISHATGQVKAPIAEGDSLAFAIRDGQAYVLHNGDVVALTNFGPEDVKSWRERDVSDSACRIAIAAQNCSLALDRITIHRDVYYVGSERDFHAEYAVGGPFELPADECFVLGDNSPRSLDSRFFGGVPAADILGVVRWIYWPKSRWHELQ